MTNLEKRKLREYCKRGLSLKDIRPLMDCSDSTIRQYIKVFAPTNQSSEEKCSN